MSLSNLSNCSDFLSLALHKPTNYEKTNKYHYHYAFSKNSSAKNISYRLVREVSNFLVKIHVSLNKLLVTSSIIKIISLCCLSLISYFKICVAI